MKHVIFFIVVVCFSLSIEKIVKKEIFFTQKLIIERQIKILERYTINKDKFKDVFKKILKQNYSQKINNNELDKRIEENKKFIEINNKYIEKIRDK